MWYSSYINWIISKGKSVGFWLDHVHSTLLLITQTRPGSQRPIRTCMYNQYSFCVCAIFRQTQVPYRRTSVLQHSTILALHRHSLSLGAIMPVWHVQVCTIKPSISTSSSAAATRFICYLEHLAHTHTHACGGGGDAVRVLCIQLGVIKSGCSAVRCSAAVATHTRAHLCACISHMFKLKMNRWSKG